MSDFAVLTDHPHIDAAGDCDRYQQVRAHTEALAAALTAEDQCLQSMPDRQPGEMASRAYHLVLRAIHSCAVPARLPRLR